MIILRITDRFRYPPDATNLALREALGFSLLRCSSREAAANT